MNVIELDEIADADLLSSSVTEDDYPAWDASVNYLIGQRVTRAAAGVHRNFEALAAGVDAVLPEISATSETPRWLNLGPTNRWAMLDNGIGTATVATDLIDVSLSARGCGDLVLMELVGRFVRVERVVDGQIIFDQDIDLDSTPIGGFYDWFFEPYRQRTSVVVRDLPAAVYSGSLRVRITGTSGVACGVCRPGNARNYGEVQIGVEFGIEDYSIKNRDRWGGYSVNEGAYSQLVKCRIASEPEDFNETVRRIASLRARLAYYELTDMEQLITLNVLGYYKDFRMNLDAHTLYYVTLELESLALTL